VFNGDTIAAIATPPGIGGIGIIRISGPLAKNILTQLFQSKRATKEFKSHKLYYGHIIDPETREVVDEVLAVLMRAPHSYTGEDVVEIHAHGGPLILKKLLDLTLKAGARLAEPGEFTKRAFLNGRLDLTQAEAVIDVISARTERELKIATHQLQGYLSERIKKIRNCLREFKAHLEVAIDFPEEDIEIVPPKLWLSRIKKEVIEPIERLVKIYSENRALREGAVLAIVGKPNVGKSSLLNCLLKEERAIVTPIPGTTRDVIEEVLNINGVAIRIADTAGLRKTQDVVETIGVERAKEKISVADIILWVVDRSVPLEEEDREIFEEIKEKKTILVLNKCDLPSVLDTEILKKEFNLPIVSISALYHQGIEKLERIIFQQLLGNTSVPEFVPKLRHKQTLEKALMAARKAKEAVEKGLPPVFVSIDIQEALDALGEIIGETTPDDVLDVIFSQFCIGK